MAMNYDELSKKERQSLSRLRQQYPGMDNETLADVARERQQDDVDLDELPDF